METRVTVSVIMLLLKAHVCDGPGRKLGKVCAAPESDVALPFQRALTCSENDNWRLEKGSTDVYFCRYTFLNYPDDSGRKNIVFKETSGSIVLLKVQHSDAGLYWLCDVLDDDSHKCTSVELVVRADEEGCKKSPGGDLSEGQNHKDSPASSDSTKASNHSTIKTPGIIGGVVGAVLFLLLLSVCVYCLIKKKCESTAAQQRSEDVEMTGTNNERLQGQDQDTTSPLTGTNMLPPDHKCHL